MLLSGLGLAIGRGTGLLRGSPGGGRLHRSGLHGGGRSLLVVGRGGLVSDRLGGLRGDLLGSGRFHHHWRLLTNLLGLAGRRAGAQALGDFGQPILGGADLAGVERMIDAGGDHGHADEAGERVVEGRAQNDVGVLVHFLTDAAGGFIDFIEGEIAAAGDGDQQAAGALHGDFVEERIGDGGLGGQNRAVVAGGLAGAHHGLAHLAHDRADVGEVEVDEALLDHEIGDGGDAGVEHLVGHGEGVRKGRLLVGDAEQVLVRDHDQRVDRLGELGDASLGQAHAARAFEVEGLGDDAHGQDAHLAGDARDDGSRARAGAAAHAGGDEAHMRAHEVIANLFERLFSRSATDLGLRARAKALGDLQAHLDDAFGLGGGERLGVGVGDDEIDAREAGHDHVVDRVAAGAADPAHHDPGLQFPQFGCLEIDGHRLASRHLGRIGSGSCLAMQGAAPCIVGGVLKNFPSAIGRRG